MKEDASGRGAMGEREMERIMMKTMSGEMMREADADERWDDDADDDETKVAVWGNNRQNAGDGRREVYDGSLQKNGSGSPIAVNHVTWLHPVCSQLLTGLKAINSPAALLETDVVNGRERCSGGGYEQDRNG